jgi:HPt (histidine-containing phosphotransfer) domain-containing protein
MDSERKLCDMRAALARMGGNAELLRQIIELIRADLPMALNHLHSAISAGNSVDLERAAHSLQGIVVTFDSEAVLLPAQSLEQMAQQGDLSRAAELAEEVDREVARLDKELLAELEMRGDSLLKSSP